MHVSVSRIGTLETSNAMYNIYWVISAALNVATITGNRYAASLSLGFGVEDNALEKHCTCGNSLHACKERAQHRVRRPDEAHRLTQHTMSWLAIDRSLVERALIVTPTEHCIEL